MSGRLLIVDDEESICFSMHDFFTEEGWEVDCARNIADARTLADSGAYDAVITDIHLTGLRTAEGLELVSYISGKNGTTRVIVLTAYGTTELQREALERGAHAFLQKTIPISQLAEALRG